MPAAAAVVQVTEGQEFSSLPEFEEAAICVCVCVINYIIPLHVAQMAMAAAVSPNFTFSPNTVLVSRHPLGKGDWI